MEKNKEMNILSPIKPSSKHSILSQYENKVMKMFSNNYNSSRYDYITQVIDRLVFNIDCHIVAVFKDHMIFDYLDEYLKREYNYEESLERVPKFATFYRNYLMFFCKPVFKDFYYNNLIQNYGEGKAELYYDQNFKDKDHKELEDPFQDLDFDENQHDYTRSIIANTIFNTSVKYTIDNHPIITNNDNSLKTSMIQKSSTKEECEVTMTLNNETLLNDSGLFNPYSSEQSLIYIMKQIQKKKTKDNDKKDKDKEKWKNILIKEKESSITSLNRHLQDNPFKVLRKESEYKSKLVAYTKLCKNPILINNAFKQLQSFNNKSQAQLKIKEKDKEPLKVKSRNYSGKSNFKTYDNNRKSLIKTQNMDNLINRIAQQVNSNLHSKQVYSIDNTNPSKAHLTSSMHSKTKSFCNLTKINHMNTNNSKSNTIKPKKLNSISSKLSSSSNQKLAVNDLHKQSCNHNEDFMKITLALLMDNSKQIKNSSSHSRVAGSLKHIQNVNINISNQININNNVQLQDSVTPKLLKNDRVEVNIQSNLNKLFNSNKFKGQSRNRDNQSTSVGKIDDTNENGTIGKKICMWNNTNTMSNNNKNNNNFIFPSSSNIEKLKKKNCSRNKPSSNSMNTLQKQISKSLSRTNTNNIPKSKIAFTSHQFIQGIKKLRTAPYCCSFKNNMSQSKQSIKNK